ncbi:hypothetical protein [Antarctobacter sp.]|uniref:hypothetical protein n=1 Tax=Antarctobacter sp. TaxID=1872577 RepID=UPI003A8D2E6A
MTETFTFRRAPLRAATGWRLEGDLLIGPPECPVPRCALTEIEAAVFVDMSVQFMRLRRLDLIGPSGPFRIAINARRGLPPDDPDRAAHRALCQAVATRLAERAPDLPVRIGESGGLRRVWFGIGLLSLLTGLGIGAAALATGVRSDRLVGMAVPLAALAVFGGMLLHRYAPWRKQAEIPVSALPALLAALDTAKAPSRGI